jgi:hypothetical protein
MIWVITAMLVYHDVDKPKMTDYMIKSFDTKFECIDYTWQNKVDMIDELLSIHRNLGDKELKTFAFYCENRYVEMDEV